MHTRKYFYYALLALLVLGVSMALPLSTDENTPTQEYEPPLAHNSALKEKESSDAPLSVFGSIPYWDQERAVAVFKEQVTTFDMISVFWYRLGDGSIVPYNDAEEDQSIITYAHNNDVKVLALIANLPEEGDWDASLVNNVIDTDENRTAHVRDIVALLDKKGFDGVNIDYEFLKNRQRDDFSAFIQELADALTLRGKILAVAIHAQEPGGPTRGQDLRALSAADILVFMTYNEHWEESEPGPIASVPWVRSILEHAESLGIDPQKIFLGMPLYGYDWARNSQGWDSAVGLEYEDVVRIANAHDADIVYDSVNASPRFSYTDPRGTYHEVWFENSRSFEAKLALAHEFNLGGIMFWRLGREDERIYDILSKE